MADKMNFKMRREDGILGPALSSIPTVTRQVARDVWSRLLARTLRAALMVNDQDLDRLGLRKQR
jgi:hypothetical protein